MCSIVVPCNSHLSRVFNISIPLLVSRELPVQTKLQIPRQVGWFPCRPSDCFQPGLTGDQHPKSLSIWSKGLFKHLHNKPRHCRHANDVQQRPRLSSISIIPLRKMSIKAKPRHSSSTSVRSILPVHPHDNGAATETQPPSAVAVVVAFLGTFSADLRFGACKGLVSDSVTLGPICGS